MRMPTYLMVCALFAPAIASPASAQLVQVREDFSSDPGWDHYQNRIVGTGMPQVIQDVGWRRPALSGGPGEIGGRVANSRR